MFTSYIPITNYLKSLLVIIFKCSFSPVLARLIAATISDLYNFCLTLQRLHSRVELILNTWTGCVSPIWQSRATASPPVLRKSVTAGDSIFSYTVTSNFPGRPRRRGTSNPPLI
jgi:hypothetical protein